MQGALTHELISGAVDGENVFGSVGQRLNLLAQLRDEVVDGPCGRKFLVAPDLVQNLLARDHLAGVLDEIAQQIEFASCEFDPLLAAARLMELEIDLEL